MTSVLPRSEVLDLVVSVRRLGGLRDHLTIPEQFLVGEELRNVANRIDRGARPPLKGRLVLISKTGFRWPLYRLVS
jgi:hypothetical protein